MNLVNFFYSNNIFNSYPKKWQYYFQHPCTPSAIKQINLYNKWLVICIFLIIFVSACLYIVTLINNFYENRTYHDSLAETIWTLIPILILSIMLSPSLITLYKNEFIPLAEMSFKAIANQWYWQYEFSKKMINNPHGSNIINSYMLKIEELKLGMSKYIETDKKLLLPTRTSIRCLVTSRDVLHSFGVQSLGIKVDAVPGKLNQVHIFILRPGYFLGHCYEICGANHAFMPINVKSIPKSLYFNKK